MLTATARIRLDIHIKQGLELQLLRLHYIMILGAARKGAKRTQSVPKKTPPAKKTKSSPVKKPATRATRSKSSAKKPVTNQAEENSELTVHHGQML